MGQRNWDDPALRATVVRWLDDWWRRAQTIVHTTKDPRILRAINRELCEFVEGIR